VTCLSIFVGGKLVEEFGCSGGLVGALVGVLTSARVVAVAVAAVWK